AKIRTLKIRNPSVFARISRLAHGQVPHELWSATAAPARRYRTFFVIVWRGIFGLPRIHVVRSDMGSRSFSADSRTSSAGVCGRGPCVWHATVLARAARGVINFSKCAND